MKRNLSKRLSDLFGRTGKAGRRGRRPSVELAVERLEARDLPSTAPLLQISSNGRYLVTSTGQPFYLVGDTAWALPAGLTLAEATSYFQTRASQGYNAVLMDADVELGASPVGAPVRGPLDANGNAPFNATLPDGNYDVSSVPVAGDTTSTAALYWQNIHNIVAAAEQNGIEVVLDVYDNYNPWFTGGNSPNSTAKLNAYGVFLGKEFADLPNIVWMLCNDYNENSAGDADLTAVIQGIRQNDTTHLGWAMDEFGATFDNTGLKPYLQLNSIYEYSTGPWRSTYLAQYDRANFGPIFNIESGYENNSSLGMTEQDLRDEHYSFLLAGATGDMYGNEFVWPFADSWQSWQNALTSEGAHEMTYLANLINSIPWYNLTPDQNGTVFQGVGSPTDYSGAYTTDGTLALAYQPSTGTGSQSFTVNMGHFAGTVTAQWYDPTSGTYTTIGSFANSGTHTFNTPNTNSAGDNDFVLVLRAAATAPAAPTGVTATPGNNQVALAWTASAGAVTYDIYRSTTPGGEGSTPYLTNIGNTSFTDTGLTNGTTYYYQITAVNSVGQSPKSSEVSATPQLVAPPAPIGLTATAGNTQVSLSWTASSGATSYNIYRSTTSGTETLLASGDTSTSYNDTAVTNGTTYYYEVTAVNSAGESGKSSEVSVTPSNNEFMGEKNILSADDSGNANLLLAQQATLAQAGTLQSLSFYVTQAAGNLILGVYDASGPNGGPGKLLAQTNAFTPITGWNTANVTTPVQLAAGTYWLAYLPSDNNLHFAVDRTSGTADYYSFAFGPMAATFSTTPNTTTSHWSFYATLTVGTTVAPPTITTQPASVTVNAGQSASFSVVASGTGPLTYQWQKLVNGLWTNITGATSATYTISAVTAANAGSYWVVVSNSGGSATSNAVSLTVNSASQTPTFVQASANQTNSSSNSVSLGSSTASGDTVVVEVDFSSSVNFTSLTDNQGNTYVEIGTQQQSTSFGANSRLYYATNIKGGAFTVTSTLSGAPGFHELYVNEYSGINSASPLAGFSVHVGTGSSFTSNNLTTTAANDLLYGIEIDSATGTAAAGWTPRSTYDSNIDADLIAATAGSYAFTGSSSGGSIAWIAAFQPASTTATAPSITTQPTSQTVTAGQSVSFTAAASGSPTPTVQWEISTNSGSTWSNISGATSTTYSFTAAASQSGDAYRAVFTNSAGSATSSAATLTVNTAPTITTQPSSQTVTAGQSVSFTAAASGTPTPTVQWQVSTNSGSTWSNISGATSSTYSFTAATSQSGNQYRAVFTNSAGSATSNAATLTVNAVTVAPTITTQPTSQTVTAGQSVSFAAAASGTPTPTVQWQLSTNGGSTWSNISGATSTMYSFTAATTQNGNEYRAVFTNSAGSATSNAATLTVNAANPAPTFVQANANNSGAAANAVTLASATKSGDTVVVEVDFSNTTNFTSISDNQGNTYVEIGTQQQSTSFGAFSRLYYATNIKGGALTVTTALAGTPGFHELYVSEYSGISTSSPLDGFSVNVGTGSSFTSKSLTTTAANDLLYGIEIDSAVGTAAAGWTPRSTLDSNVTADKTAATAGSYAFTGSSSGGFISWIAAFKADPPATPGKLVTAINAGGGATGPFAADTAVSGGSTFSTSAAINTSNALNPAPASVYQSERYGNFTYTISNLTPNGSYVVQLDFAEIYWNSAGSRLFNVVINGTQVLTNFDIFAAAGGKDIAIDEQFPVHADSSGKITIQFISVKDNAKLSGLEVFAVT